MLILDTKHEGTSRNAPYSAPTHGNPTSVWTQAVTIGPGTQSLRRLRRAAFFQSLFHWILYVSLCFWKDFQVLLGVNSHPTFLEAAVKDFSWNYQRSENPNTFSSRHIKHIQLVTGSSEVSPDTSALTGLVILVILVRCNRTSLPLRVVYVVYSIQPYVKKHVFLPFWTLDPMKQSCVTWMFPQVV